MIIIDNSDPVHIMINVASIFIQIMYKNDETHLLKY